MSLWKYQAFVFNMVGQGTAGEFPGTLAEKPRDNKLQVFGAGMRHDSSRQTQLQGLSDNVVSQLS
jgi:hypothetical protein